MIERESLGLEVTMKCRTTTAFSLLSCLVVGLTAQQGHAQDVGGGDDAPPSQATGANAAAASAAGAPIVVVQPGSTTTTTTAVPPPGYPAPGTDVNAGLDSSARPVTDTSTAADGFDLRPGGGAGGEVVRGQAGATAVLGGQSKGTVAAVPEIHTVHKGDTLWGLCEQFYGNPWAWPKVWSYNPQIQNPHWIYPGDQLRMRREGDAKMARSFLGRPGGGEGFIDRRGVVPKGTVFLRNLAYIDDPERNVWGEIVGAREDQMMLGADNHVYMTIRPGVELETGQELKIFRAVRRPPDVSGARRPPGEIIMVLGSVRVQQWNPKSHIARGLVAESTDVIERGAQVGPLTKRLEVVPPKVNDKDLWARILTSVYPQVYMSDDQVVFIDKGSEDGLKPGNRLSVVRRGDVWRRGLGDSTSMAVLRMRQDVSDPVVYEKTPLRGDEQKFPEEEIAELRVLKTQKFSSVALVTSSSSEIVVGDRAIARKGY